MRVYQSYDLFVLDDPHRLVGPEVDFGWWPLSHRPAHPSCGARLTWNQASDDLYLFNACSGTVVVLARLADENTVRAALSGWEDAVFGPRPGRWLMTRIGALSAGTAVRSGEAAA